ncbi:MAG: hypothetical protein JNL83_35705 [Myxococcales bacterium]|nr:hypothetical protein [Myxococcales bacterium]
MLRVVGLVGVVALSACAAEPPTPPTITVSGANDESLASVDLESLELADGAYDEVGDPCALADALPDGDMCSLVCFPDQLAAAMLDAGTKAHACYQLRCTLSPTVTVSVGVCLP